MAAPTPTQAKARGNTPEKWDAMVQLCKTRQELSSSNTTSLTYKAHTGASRSDSYTHNILSQPPPPPPEEACIGNTSLLVDYLQAYASPISRGLKHTG